ncbi:MULTISPECIES: DUF4190 domain-containing protein [unclassified Nocardioides]|uniref:DUF4190 domain-containing protein n=1 Tax=unclassified Nocardioides TaxID=2615069 RepID=UPI0006F26F1F|nr:MULTISPECIES: DUF4190 domain-containing protein [unclassified Nocardioides]KRA30872.1 hypothetical protein ASD81_15305 [Nocardioides sp. Root614]KRA87492.1 hypothetical protein ASD84_15575 [Nocardioides sp. Root682]
MSDQPPLTSPSQPSPGFEPYQAPAYGDVAPEAPTQQAPVSPAPVAPYPTTPYQVAPQYLRHVAPTHPMATTSLALGVSGLVGLVLTPVFFFTFVAVLCSPFAIWTGARARREIRANPQAFGGEGLATGGFITGIIGVVLGVIGLLLVVAVVVFFVSVFSSYEG